MKSLINNGILLVGCIGLLASLNSCSTQAPEQTAEEIKEKTPTVEIISPEQRSFQAEISITGTALPNQSIMLYAMESGVVQSITKNIGDNVVKGDVIATLYNPELVRLKEKMTSNLNAKRDVYKRLKISVERTPDLTPQQLIDEAKAAYEMARAELKIIDDRLSFLQIEAPFSGIITQRFVDHGAMVQSGFANPNAAQIVEIQQVNPIVLTVALPESDADAVRKGTMTSIEFPELAGNGYSAVVSRTAGVLDHASKTMQVEIDIPNNKNEIKSGMYAKVAIELESQDSLLSLPHDAQFLYKNELFLLVVKDGIVERIPFRKGLSNKDYFEVLNGDIDENTQVIVQGKSLVTVGQTVNAISK